MLKSKLKILYIEDEQNIREVFTNFFARRAQEVVVASDGLEGYEAYKREKPDLIVTDIQMPFLDGVALIRKIRECDNDIPIIVTSGQNDKDDLLNLINLNVTRFVLKPMDRSNLKVVITDVIELIELRKKEVKYKEEINKYNLELERLVEEKIVEIKEKDNLIVQQSKMAQMGNMINVIAHQWKQPLNIIFLTNELIKMLLAKDKVDKEDIGKQLTIVSEQIKFMDNTINDFKNFYSPNKIDVEFMPYGCIKSIMKLIEYRIKQNNVEIIFKRVNEKCLCIGFPNEFKQVILNILNNSLENFEEKKQKGGKIIITLEHHEEDLLEIDICDNGGGIEESLLPEAIFSNNTTTKVDGSGIGLSISKFIIEQNLKGTLKAYNNEDGACFKIILPKCC